MATRPFSPKAGSVDLLGDPPELSSATRSVVLQRGREVAAFLLFTAGLFVLLALLTYRRSPVDPTVQGLDWVGPVGATVASWLVQGFGCIALLVPLEMALVGLPLFRGQGIGPWGLRVAGDLIVAIVASAIVQVLWPDATQFGEMPASGNVGMLFGELMRGMFSTPGSLLVGTTAIGLVLLGRSAFSFIELCQKSVELTIRGLQWLRLGSNRVVAAWIQARRLNRAEVLPAEPIPVVVSTHLSEEAIIAKLSCDDSDWIPFDETGTPPMAILDSLREGLSAATSSLAESETPTAPKVTLTFGLPVDSAGAQPRIVAPVSRAARRKTLQDAAPPIIVKRSTEMPTRRGKAPPADEELDDDTSALPGELAEEPENPEFDEELDEEASEEGEEETCTSDEEESDEEESDEEESDEEEYEEESEEDDPETCASDEEESDEEESDEEEDEDEASEADDDTEASEPDEVDEETQLDEVSESERRAEQRRKIAAADRAVAAANKTPYERSATGPAAVAAALVANAERRDTAATRPTPPANVPAKRRKFRLPSTELLQRASGNEPQIDTDRVLAHAQRLEKTLLDYGVSGKVEEIHPGPTVTTYEFAPQAGTKVSKVAGLADDLALGLSRKVRIIAPIPGKSRIGFELPNDQRIPVNLRELVEDSRFATLAEKVPLPVVMGRDIVGAPFYADLASLPHVIVAGATGAGKSVGLNVMLASLLFKRTPDDLRMLMIDPKVVELAPFDKIPHLLLPVVTDMKQANLALKWAVDEMERRYQLFATAGTKNIGTYNRWAERVALGELPPPPPAAVEALSADGAVITVPATKDGSDGSNLPGKLPYIVIVIDEFADLIMQQGKEVEASVARLAQKARAAGLHVILATQRPSVDVITGMIKANFPSRVSYLVAQKVDSRTILDEQGAELLLGRGDMLVKLNGSNDVKRVQCPFISEDEVSGLTDYLRTQGQPNYHEVILQQDDEGEDASEEEATDARFDEAVRIVAETGRCSTSWLQRKMTIGYNRAAKIVEAMERRGMVGPPNGAKDREVLILPH